jgi:hypothetical protein
MELHETPLNTGVNSGAPEGYAVPAPLVSPHEPYLKNGDAFRCSRRVAFLLLITHTSYYSYIQSSPVKVLAVMEKTKHLRKKYKILFGRHL